MNIFLMKKKNTKGGFTLVELLVSISIFAIVMTISLGAILTILDSNRKAQSLKSVMNNLNYALENMTRTIKTSRSFSSIDGSSIDIVDTDGHRIRYELNTNKQITISDDDPANYFDQTPITADEIKIDALSFDVKGSNVNDGLQPRVTMIVKGTAGVNKKTQSEFSLQTTVSKRVLQN